MRVRPTNTFEQQSGDHDIVQCEPEGLIVEGKSHHRKFLFDAVFDPAATQEDVFEISGIKRLVNMSIDGFVLTY